MSISFGVAGVAALVALVLTAMLVQRCVRMPRLDLAALAVAGLGLTVALASQALGFDKGFTPTTFRALHLGAQLLAPMALAWALAEMAGKSLGSRFAARLALGGLTMVAAVVLASDPLSSATFSTAWPASSVFYQLIPNAILELVAVVTALAAVVAVAVTAVRARRYPGWHDLFGAVVAAAVAALATDGLRVALPSKAGYVGICLLVMVLTWFAGRLSGRVRLDVLRLGGPIWNEDTGEFVRYNEDTGEFAPYRDDMYTPRAHSLNGGYQPDAADPGYSGWYDSEAGDVQPEGADADFSGWFRDDTGGAAREPAGRGYGGYTTDPHFARMPAAQAPANGHAAAFETGDMLPQLAGYQAGYQGANGGAPEADVSRLYGQIAIYTLLDGRVDDFDMLAQRVVEQVKAGEPGTMVYVMHGVPSAPMQRILYEVYRDEAAFEEHVSQPYVRQFEEERKPCVLATNVIELGVRHAKFTPATAQPQPQRQARGEARPWSNGAR
jgi:quinol monooxygenase YgiN